MVARTDEKQEEADSLPAVAAEQDKRRIYLAMHRDIAYAMASQSENYAAAAGHLRKYVVGHIAVHGSLPSDIDEVYDKMALCGDNEGVPSAPAKVTSPEGMHADGGAGFHPTVWDTPADLAAYDAAPQASMRRIEDSFGGALRQEPASDPKAN